MFHRARLPPIVGFLVTGLLCGPFGFGLIDGVEHVEALAEIGVILLLFTVGIEFSVEELSRVRTFLLTGGALQVSLTLGATTAAASAFGLRLPVAILLGMLVALSSTAIAIRMLAERNELDAPHGRAAIGILIFQDLVVVPMVLVTPFLGGAGGDVKDLLIVIAKAGAFIALAIVAARWVIPWLLHIVVGTRKREVFLLTIVLICLGMAVASAQVGLSMALGAFIAGLILSESEYSHQALGEVRPDALQQPRGQILLEPFGRRRRRRPHPGGLELQAMGAVADPDAARLDRLARGDGGHPADDGREVGHAGCTDAQNREAALLVVVGDPLDDARHQLPLGSRIHALVIPVVTAAGRTAAGRFKSAAPPVDGWNSGHTREPPCRPGHR